MENENMFFSIIECILFVSGDPVEIKSLQDVLEISKTEIIQVLNDMNRNYKDNDRGIQLFITEDTVQLVSNKKYFDYVIKFMQPVQRKNFSQSMLETLSIIAYKQPVTRSEIEAIRGVRCEYSLSQLIKHNLVIDVGKKDTIGHPTLFGTTDEFLRKFGLHSIDELPEYSQFAANENETTILSDENVAQ